MNIILPDWPATEQIHALVSTRQGGISKAPFDTLNLGAHVGDDLEDVMVNRSLIENQLPNKPLWLKQTHSTIVSTPQSRLLHNGGVIHADASVTNIPGEVLVVLTADCLPVLFTNNEGGIAGAAHAGWRGLCNGILENTVRELLAISGDSNANNLMAWLGPAIGPAAFEVGDDVVSAFENSGLPFSKGAFLPVANKNGKFLANLYELARMRLEACGVQRIFGGGYCTVRDRTQFFSYRRDGITGRFASAIWIAK